jgi:hypothetical protein
MDTVFRIGDMKQIKNRLRLVNLILTSNNDTGVTYMSATLPPVLNIELSY